MARRVAAAILGIVVLLLAPTAHAHKLKVFAAAVGPRIEGAAYFIGGGPVQDARATIEAAGSNVTAETKTDEEGRFAFTPTHRVDHVIRVHAGDGHSTEITVPARELPTTLPAAEGIPEPTEPTSTHASAPPAAAASPVGTPAALEDLVREAVAQEIVPLREQIASAEERIRFRDVLGGIGYILGLSGLALWLDARRVRRRQG